MNSHWPWKAGHTFATTVTLSKGIPIESVGENAGIDPLRLQIYAKVLDKKVGKDMEILEQLKSPRLQIEIRINPLGLGYQNKWMVRNSVFIQRITNNLAITEGFQCILVNLK